MTEDKTKPEWKAQKTYAQNRIDSKVKATLPPLTPEEEARPFAKYYYEKIKPYDPAHYAGMDQPIDPARAFGPEEINRLLDVKRLETEEVEIGWCNLTNGAGFIANKIFYPGVTADMIDWWFAWHPLEDLRYRIWYPPQHAGIMLSATDRARILDPGIPNREKNWGVTHYVTENCDCGMENVDIRFRSPADMGFDMERFNKVITAFAGGEGWAVAVDKEDSSIAAPSIMCHVFYNAPGGLIHRTRFWMGYRFTEEGKPKLCLPPGVSVPVASVQGLARHNVKEFTRLGDFLPRIYKELGHSMYC
ncbi:MAG: hydrolase [Acidobacteria bacterium]|nr:hydrolase [Acidobacteriota bacterium]